MKPFLLTQYIYPIERETKLSGNDFSFDNPRNDSEIQLVREVLERMYDSSYRSRSGELLFPLNKKDVGPQIISVEGALKDFFEVNGRDEYVEEFKQKHWPTQDLFDIIARMWVIARYNDEGAYAALNQEQLELDQANKDSDGVKHFIMLDDDNPIISNSHRLEAYTYLLTLLFHTDEDDPPSRNVLLHEHWEPVNEIDDYRKVSQSILFFILGSHSNFDKHPQDKWKWFPEIKNEIILASQKIDNLKKAQYGDAIEYISETLMYLGKTSVDPKIEIVSLTSLIELLLTYSPNYQRFNVEDSISKQFKLKASVLLYLYKPDIPIETYKEKLGEIYNQRSNIAHGNYRTLKKYMKKKADIMRKDDPDYEDSFVLNDIAKDLRQYLRYILNMIVRDPSLVKFMKEN